VQPGDRITYTVEIHADTTDLTGASVVDPIPTGTTFAGFGVNPIGATYDGTNDEVEWSGTVTGGSDPVTFTFGVDVDLSGWSISDPITNTVVFDSGAGLVFTRTAVSTLDFPDPSPSVKTVDKDRALEGDVLTYTIRVENASSISDTFTLMDPIPADATYVSGSLTYTLGTGSYDAVNNAIDWTGTLPAMGTYVNTSGGYEWGDSDGNGVVPGVTFEWIDVSATGTNIGAGDETYYCSLPLGFSFDFYGATEITLCASTNGFVSFDTSGYSDLSNDCPLPSTNGNAALIAGIWDDLVVNDGIYYQTFGSAPNRYTVIQWSSAQHYLDTNTFDFEIILHENGAIKVQMLTAGPETGSGSTTGIEDYTETQGLTYACNTTSSIHDDLAIVFLPAGATWQTTTRYADVTFAVTTATGLPANAWITNTATITGSLSVVERSAGTLINPLDLSTSVKTADKGQALVNEVVTYDFSLQNTGLLTATGAVLTDAIPANTTYVPGSVACSSGACAYDPGGDAITWSGDIVAGSPITLTFAVTLTTVLPDQTPVINTATLDDGFGGSYDLEALFLARSSNLSASFKQAAPNQVGRGGTVTYTVYIYNSGDVETVGEMSDVLPTGVTYVPSSLFCGGGSCGEAAGVVTWTGTVPPRSMVPVRFQVTVSAAAAPGTQITNIATVTDTSWGVDYPAAETITVRYFTNERDIYLPLVLRDF
jgi:uncharacterized repeat protein (TIGR01451 family)